LSPHSWEKRKIEKKYKKKVSRAMETLIGRVDHNSNSSGSSGDEKALKTGSKKRKYQEYCNGLKKHMP
jgi:hypothetical protein